MGVLVIPYRSTYPTQDNCSWQSFSSFWVTIFSGAMLVSGRVILVWGVDPTYTLQGVPTICNYGSARLTKVQSLEPVLPLRVTRFKRQRHTQCHYLFKVRCKHHQASDGGCFQHVHPFGNYPKRFFCHPKMIGYMECSKIFGIGV